MSGWFLGLKLPGIKGLAGVDRLAGGIIINFDLARLRQTTLESVSDSQNLCFWSVVLFSEI
jgi:hypothetical protein